MTRVKSVRTPSRTRAMNRSPKSAPVAGPGPGSGTFAACTASSQPLRAQSETWLSTMASPPSRRIQPSGAAATASVGDSQIGQSSKVWKATSSSGNVHQSRSSSPGPECGASGGGAPRRSPTLTLAPAQHDLVGGQSGRRRATDPQPEFVVLRAMLGVLEGAGGGAPPQDLPDIGWPVGVESGQDVDGSILVADDPHRGAIRQVVGPHLTRSRATDRLQHSRFLGTKKRRDTNEHGRSETDAGEDENGQTEATGTHARNCRALVRC